MQPNKIPRGILIIGFLELAIGTMALAGLLASLMNNLSSKPPEVIVFVFVASLISLSLGIGILRYNLSCYRLLLYFSTVIILSKLLIFGKIIVLAGALETAIPAPIKNITSMLYHGLVVFYLTRPSIKRIFQKAPQDI